jgi:ankyrin repeat protein
MKPKQDLPQETIDQFVGAAHGNFALVKDLLARHPELLNARSSDDETAIQAASHTGQKQIVEYLLQEGAPLDVCAAALLGRTEELRRLIAVDKSLVKATGSHNIPLMFYVGCGGNLETARLLLENGIDLNAGEGVITGLHGAVFSNSQELLQWLLENGARPELKDHGGKTALDLAAHFKRAEIEQILRRG